MAINRAHVVGLLPFIIAYGEGKEIQLNIGTAKTPNWVTQTGCLSFTSVPENYRIKPVPQTVWICRACDGTVSFVEDKEDVARKRFDNICTNGMYQPYTLKSYTENL
jgi:hypothetical protein